MLTCISTIIIIINIIIIVAYHPFGDLRLRARTLDAMTVRPLGARQHARLGVHRLFDEPRLRAQFSIVALAPSSLTATHCPQLKQVVRRCPQLLLYLGVKMCFHM
jgi:hypothetical protein